MQISFTINEEQYNRFIELSGSDHSAVKEAKISPEDRRKFNLPGFRIAVHILIGGGYRIYYTGTSYNYRTYNVPDFLVRVLFEDPINVTKADLEAMIPEHYEDEVFGYLLWYQTRPLTLENCANPSREARHIIKDEISRLLYEYRKLVPEDTDLSIEGYLKHLEEKDLQYSPSPWKEFLLAVPKIYTSINSLLERDNV